MRDEESDGDDASDLLEATELCRLRGSLEFAYGAMVSLGGAIPDVELVAALAGFVGTGKVVLGLRELKLDEDRCLKFVELARLPPVALPLP